MSRNRRTLRLLFNISVPEAERVVRAELRLHMLLKKDSHPQPGWKVTIFDMGRHGTGESDPLVSKHVHRQDSGWEVFDMTEAIRHWRKVNIATPRLEVHIQSLKAFRSTYESKDRELEVDGKHEPVLIVFSDDPSQDHWTVAEDEDEEAQVLSNAISKDGSRVRRSAKVEDCRKAEMYVDFKDIGWDSFVLAPTGYQAFTCRGACKYPLAQEVTPTKHAIVQTLLNLKSPQKASRACCVPTELKPISLLYQNENGVVVLNNKYEGMVVKECGCR